ncbi:MAG: methionyl-tRNA formyltransferase [Dehalococcoidales bacterium]|nr:methionyl-tRNA formyltransferase [Dehalococcoidales bacterium]
MRIVFMGSPGFAVPALERLILGGYDVVGVYTQPDRPAGRGRSPTPPPVKNTAIQRGLPVFQPESLRSAEALEQLEALKPDIIVICAFGQILTQAVLDIPPRQCVNVHFSLLPRHRGASPVAAAILAGDEFTGVSIQLVRKKLDTGPILTRAAVPISPRDNTGSLTEKLGLVGANLLLEALTGWLRNEITTRPQDEEEATYFSQIDKEAGEIDWNLPAVEIWRRVRAYYPWPGGYTSWRGRQLKIIEAEALPGEKSPGAGKVVALPGQRAGIGTGEGVLGVLRVQLEGKKAMSAADFLRGQWDFTDSTLPD